jgi:beta-lactamase regulating signal transducer with metallopeptidase domain
MKVEIILTTAISALLLAIGAWFIAVPIIIIEVYRYRKMKQSKSKTETEGNKTTAEASEFEIYKQAADIEKHLKKDK